MFSFIDIICPFLFVFQIVSIEHVAISVQPNEKMAKNLMKKEFKSEAAEQVCYFSGKIKVAIGLKSIQTKRISLKVFRKIKKSYKGDS